MDRILPALIARIRILAIPKTSDRILNAGYGTNMELTPDKIASFPLPLFQRFGARCCRRIQQHITDTRFEKSLRKLERCSGLSPREQLRRDAFNAANAAYHELYQTHSCK